MSIYTNGLSIQMNEIAIITFMENSQNASIPVCQVAITYEVLKMMNKTIADCIEQYEAKLHTVVSDMGRAN